MSDQEVQKGDKVSWDWNGSNPSGTVGEVKAGEVTVTSHRGNEIKKTGDESNPAVHIERSGNDVVKLADELNVEKKAEGSNGTTNGTSSEEKKDEEDKPAEEEVDGEAEKEVDGEEEKEEEKKEDSEKAQVGDKRKADAPTKKEEKKNGKPETKKQKTEKAATEKAATEKADAPAKTNGEKKKAGRPKGSGTGDKAKREKKVPAVGQALRKTRSQGKAE